MKLARLLTALTAALMLAAVSVNPAAAATASYDYDFGIFLTGDGGAGTSTPGGTSSAAFAHLSVRTDDFLTFDFDLKLSNLDTVFGSMGAFVSALEVNTFRADPSTSTILPGTWGVQAVQLDTSASSSGSISWDFTNEFCAPNGGGNCNSGNNPENRLQGSEQVKWTTVFTTAQNPPFDDPAFMLHVQGYAYGSVDDASSKWVPLTPVPEPEIYAMMGLGLGLMGFVARRRKQNTA